MRLCATFAGNVTIVCMRTKVSCGQRSWFFCRPQNTLCVSVIPYATATSAAITGLSRCSVGRPRLAARIRHLDNRRMVAPWLAAIRLSRLSVIDKFVTAGPVEFCEKYEILRLMAAGAATPF